MLQTVIQFPTASRITSYSISFHPAMQRSIKHCPTRLRRRPLEQISCSSSSLCAIPPPLPPRVYAGRIPTGEPISLANAIASSTCSTTILAAIGSWIFSIVSLNSKRSSARLIVCAVVPIRRTFSCFKKPDSSNSIAIFNAACPPSVGSTLSGLSLRISF